MKAKAIASALLLLLTLSSCSAVQESFSEKTNTNSTEISASEESKVNIEKLKEKYPEYFEMSAFKGIEVYVWQMAEISYQCGMMSGTNRSKTNEELLELQSKSLSIDEAKAILDEIGVDKNYIIVIPISQPCSSYYYDINDEYIERIQKLFE